MKTIGQHHKHIQELTYPPPPSAVCRRQWTGSALVQVVGSRLFGAKPLPKPMLACCQLDSWEKMSMKFWSESFSFKKIDFKMSSVGMLAILTRGVKLGHYCLYRYVSAKLCSVIDRHNMEHKVDHDSLDGLFAEQTILIHHDDVGMGAIAYQITSLTIVYSIVYSDADQRKHQSSASLAFVWGILRGPVNSPHKWPVTRKMFPFDDVIMHISKEVMAKSWTYHM